MQLNSLPLSDRREFECIAHSPRHTPAPFNPSFYCKSFHHRCSRQEAQTARVVRTSRSVLELSSLPLQILLLPSMLHDSDPCHGGVPKKCADTYPSEYIPHSHGVVIAPSADLTTIAAPRHRLHPIGVAFDRVLRHSPVVTSHTRTVLSALKPYHHRCSMSTPIAPMRVSLENRIYHLPLPTCHCRFSPPSLLLHDTQVTTSE